MLRLVLLVALGYGAWACTTRVHSTSISNQGTKHHYLGQGEHIDLKCATQKISVKAVSRLCSWWKSASEYNSFEVYIEGRTSPDFDKGEYARRLPLYSCDRCSEADRKSIVMTDHNVLYWFVVFNNNNDYCDVSYDFEVTAHLTSRQNDCTCNGRGKCITPGICKCDTGYWDGALCEVCAPGRGGPNCEYDGLATDVKAINRQPVVLVHGVFGFGNAELGPISYWGRAEAAKHPQPLLVASVGPISSGYDRAMELIAQIKGVRTDYGENHSKAEKHQRYGVDYTGRGLYPSWSKDDPIHLVCHSLGGPTCRWAQYLLAQDAMGWGSDADWVMSMTCISPVHSGTALTHWLGANDQTGIVNKFSVLTVLVKIINTLSHLDPDVVEKYIYDFDLDHWGDSRKDGEPVWDYARRIIEQTPLADGKDNAVYTLTFPGAYEDGKIPEYPNTYYFNHPTSQTFKNPLTGNHLPKLGMNPVFAPTSIAIGHYTFDKPPIPNPDEWPGDEYFWENDGATPTWGGIIPRWPKGAHKMGDEFDHMSAVTSSFRPGVWHYSKVEGDHLDITLLAYGEYWSNWYEKLFSRLSDLHWDRKITTSLNTGRRRMRTQEEGPQSVYQLEKELEEENAWSAGVPEGNPHSTTEDHAASSDKGAVLAVVAMIGSAIGAALLVVGVGGFIAVIMRRRREALRDEPLLAPQELDEV